MNRPRQSPDTPSEVEVVVITDDNPLDPLTPEAEADWIPYLGPTAMALARRLVGNGSDEYAMLNLADALGVGVPRLWQAFNRLQRAKLATIEGTPPVVTLLAQWPHRRAKS